MDPSAPVTIAIDLGGSKQLSAVAIQWEFPAKSFAISVSRDGVKWSEVYATDSNVLSSNRIVLGSVAATRVRVVMHEVRCLVCLPLPAQCSTLVFALCRRLGLSTATLCMAFGR